MLLYYYASGTNIVLGHTTNPNIQICHPPFTISSNIVFVIETNFIEEKGKIQQRESGQGVHKIGAAAK